MENSQKKTSILGSSLTKYRSNSFIKQAQTLQQKFKFSEKELLLIKKRSFIFICIIFQLFYYNIVRYTLKNKYFCYIPNLLIIIIYISKVFQNI